MAEGGSTAHLSRPSTSIIALSASNSGRFDTPLGRVATPQALGGVLGQPRSGLILEHLGLEAAFDTYALAALFGAVPLFWEMPETRCPR